MAYPELLKFCLILGILFAVCRASFYGCGPGVVTPGYTIPLGDITLELGEDLNILCVLNDAAAATYGPNASQLMTYQLGNKTFPVDIVNSTAIRFHVEKHPKTQLVEYNCMVNGTFVCHNIVVVGTAPQDVTDFDCIGYNYENFTCSWTAPRNYVATKYDLEYMPTYRPVRYNKSPHKPKSPSKPKGTYPPAKFAGCPENGLKSKKINGNTTWWCTWTMGTKPQYRHSHDDFTFKLYASNVFGNRTWEFPIEHYAKVRPNPPEELTALETSPHSIYLKWKIPLYMQSFPKDLDHRVSWCIEQNNCTKWTTVYLSDVKREPMIQYELTNLPYAHCLYDIRVSMKSKLAIEERMWSLNASITVRTLSKIPDRPPNITAGSFELLDGTGNRLIYWQRIRTYEENGQNFSYYLQVDEDRSIRPVKVFDNYAKFENLPDRNYTFRIWSRNDQGISSKSSAVFFPSQKYALKQVEKLVKEDKGLGEYYLEWTESNDPRVVNYTLFWCSAQKERPYPCDGTLEWETVPKGVKNKTLKLPMFNEKNESINIYQFAISVNGDGTSSGLLWAHCTVLPGTPVKLRQTYVKTVTPRLIVLQWQLECITLGAIHGFNVSYCTFATPQSQECQPNSLKYKLFDNSTFRMGEGELRITDLKPYTAYKFRVKPIIVGAESPFSDPLVNSTLEDAPTEPRQLKVVKREDRSITIEWQKPLQENGYLRKYVILINGTEQMSIHAEKERHVYRQKIERKVDGRRLQPRTEYTIEVMACTNSCSNSSVIHTSTDVGYPGDIGKPSANWDNYSLIIKWDKPDEPGVKIDFYEVQFGTIKGPEDYHVENATSESYEIGICQRDKTQTVFVKIRAVNIKAGRLLHGNWSVRADFPCFHSPSASVWIIPLVVMLIIAFIVAMFYFVKRAWRKILGMRNCPVKLPAGLDLMIQPEKEKHSDEVLPGEPLLPEKFPSAVKGTSGESSGCCSGTESVSSSIESGGHLSITDSGTEQPHGSPSLGAEPRDPSLRQRVKKADYVSMAEISQAPWSTKINQSGYSVIGLSAPPKKSNLDSEYMPLTDIASKTPYVPFPVTETQEPLKEPANKAHISGYVPFLPHEQPSKNTAYVVAGEPAAPTKGYVVAGEPTPAPSKGYVLAGEPTATKGYILAGEPKAPKGYVPHNLKFEATKNIKED